MAVDIEYWAGVAADMDPGIDQVPIVDVRALHRHGADRAIGHCDAKSDIDVRLDYRTNDAFDLQPLAIVDAGEQLWQGNQLGAGGKGSIAEDGDMGLVDDGCEVAWSDDAYDVDKGAGKRRPS